MIATPLSGAAAEAAGLELADPRIHTGPGGPPPARTDGFGPTSARIEAPTGSWTLPAAPRPQPRESGYAPSAASESTLATFSAAKATAAKATAAKASAPKATATKASATKASTTKASTTKATTSTKAASSASTTVAKSALAFLDDKKLSIEDKLMRFVALVAQQADADIVAKMKEFEGAQAASKSTSSSTSTKSASSAPAPAAAAPKKKGFGIFDAVKVVFPAVGLADSLLSNKTVSSVVRQVTGPVLAAGATALGFPEAAPALLKVGPQVFDAAQSLAGGLKSALGAGEADPPAKAASSTASGTSSSSGSTSGASGSSAATAENQQLQLMELQRMMEKEKEMMTAISNTLRALHDMRMNTLQNIR